MEDIAIGVVLFRAGPSVFSRLGSAIRGGMAVYLYDNSPESEEARVFARKNPEVRYHTAGQNVGLGVAISTLMATAYYDGRKQLLFFDQDTVFTDRTLAFIAERLAAIPALAAYGVVSFNSRRNTVLGATRDEIVVVNSGSVFVLDSARRIGWMNPRYFVDLVDYEYCFRALLAGYRVGSIGGAPGLDHCEEQADDTYRIFGRALRLRAYPAWRIRSVLWRSADLFMRAIGSARFHFAWVLVRSLTIYAVAQVLVRCLELAKAGKESQR